MNAVMFALRWYPELKGITSVMIGVVVLMGSVYMILGTNLGSRLGLLTALTGLFGWLVIMSAIWWVYGIGLKGPDPSWVGKDVVFGDLSLSVVPQAHTIGAPNSKWKVVPEEDPSRGQAQAAADDILLNQRKLFTSNTQYIVTNVYSLGGETYPRFFFKFWHKPHYAAVVVQPTLAQNTEPGKAPPKAVADPTKKPITVVMLRNLGGRRKPAALICLGSTMIFTALAWTLHRRDQLSMAARSGSLALERA
jgi:hypothetical protein